MPFTVDGEWVPSKIDSPIKQKPVKIRLVKRGKSVLTLIENLPYSKEELEKLAVSLKKKLGCGGAVKDDIVEIQGDKVEDVKKFLSEI